MTRPSRLERAGLRAALRQVSAHLAREGLCVLADPACETRPSPCEHGPRDITIRSFGSVPILHRSECRGSPCGGHIFAGGCLSSSVFPPPRVDGSLLVAAASLLAATQAVHAAPATSSRVHVLSSLAGAHARLAQRTPLPGHLDALVAPPLAAAWALATPTELDLLVPRAHPPASPMLTRYLRRRRPAPAGVLHLWLRPRAERQEDFAPLFSRARTLAELTPAALFADQEVFLALPAPIAHALVAAGRRLPVPDWEPALAQFGPDPTPTPLPVRELAVTLWRDDPTLTPGHALLLAADVLTPPPPG